MTPSLRKRLLAGIFASTILLLTIFGLTVYFVISNALIDQFDASLAAVARILAASVEIDKGIVEMDFEEHEMPELTDRANPTYYQLWNQDGTVAISPLLEGCLLCLEGELNVPTFIACYTVDKRPLREVSLRFQPRAAEEGGEHHGHETVDQVFTLAVARDSSELLASLEFLRFILISAAGMVTILSFVIASFVVRKGLEPLNAIASEIAWIDQRNLAARIEAARAPSELVPIKVRLNNLLERLEAAFRRERRFTADVAHELRTPLAGLRSTIEVTLSRQRENVEYQGALADSLSIVSSMNSMVNNLLTLARLDARQVTLAAEPIKLAELVDAAWRPFAHKAAEREIVFQNNIPADLACRSDGEHLAMVFGNLLENAAEYTNQAGKITVSGERERDSTEIIVSNTG
ncbi:MAG: histidine kinase dimerization/phospho-acceptor domain-containing protein, partial [Planctomycetota bacterium]